MMSNFFLTDESRTGWNAGVGLMAFIGSWGVRGDLRYFRAFNQSNPTSVIATLNTPTGTVTTSTAPFLPGLDFWRANIGLAFRW
jgi:hypothetical protein